MLRHCLEPIDGHNGADDELGLPQGSAMVPVVVPEKLDDIENALALKKREFPRLCRGGSRVLDSAGSPSRRLRIVSRQAHEGESHRWMTMKA